MSMLSQASFLHFAETGLHLVASGLKVVTIPSSSPSGLGLWMCATTSSYTIIPTKTNREGWRDGLLAALVRFPALTEYLSHHPL